MGMKKAAERWVRQTLPSKLPTFLVASFGRSGSTLLTKALTEAVARERFGSSNHYLQRICREDAWSLDEVTFFGGVVYKTHDYPWALLPEHNVRPIFIFGSAVEAARSVYANQFTLGPKWIKRHFDHLHSAGSVEDLLSCDTLGFLPQFESWTNFDRVNVLCVRFEALWDNIDKLRLFTGLPIALPARRARSTKRIAAEVDERIERVFNPIDEVINRLPDIFESQGQKPPTSVLGGTILSGKDLQ